MAKDVEWLIVAVRKDDYQATTIEVEEPSLQEALKEAAYLVGAMKNLDRKMKSQETDPHRVGVTVEEK